MVRNQSRTRANAKPPRVGGTLAGLWPFRVGGVGDLVSPSGDAVYAFWRDDERLVIVAAPCYPALLVEVARRRPELGVGDARLSHHGQREHVLVGLAARLRDGRLQDPARFLSLLPILGHDDHPFRCPTRPQSTPTRVVRAGVAHQVADAPGS